MGPYILAICVSILVVGVVWFHILRPIWLSLRFGVAVENELSDSSQIAKKIEESVVPAHSDAGSDDPEPSAGTVPGTIDRSTEPSDLSHNEAVEKWRLRVGILAVLRDDSGRYMFSGQEIVAKVGKRKSDVLAEIRNHRSEMQKEPKPPQYDREALGMMN